jgi:hypothetical protein
MFFWREVEELNNASLCFLFFFNDFFFLDSPFEAWDQSYAQIGVRFIL